MSTKEKELINSITEAVSTLPEEKREYLLGYAEGVLAMADRKLRGNPAPAAPQQCVACPSGGRKEDRIS